jgi:vacuolar protein sorting-associated protein 41
MGTQWGNVHILDFNGNLNRTLKFHSAGINELSVDDYGEYIASCSNDGKQRTGR